MKKFRKLLLYFLSAWLLALIIVNYFSIIELTKFLIENKNYKNKSNSPIPKDSEYSFLYDFVSLGLSSENIPSDFILNEPKEYNTLQHWNKTNYYRMKFILKYLDSINVSYETIQIPVKHKKQVKTSNIFIKNINTDSIILITAHYDNLTKKDYQGALDNSASVAILLNTIKKNKKLLKTKKIAFLFTTGEERGLIGAKHFVNYAQQNKINIEKIICLDGVGRGEVSVMNNSFGRFGFKFRNWWFKEKIFTGSKFLDCPNYSAINNSVIDLNKYKIRQLKPFISSTDSRVFVKKGIPTIHLTSGEIAHFLKVLHTNSDKVDFLHYNTIMKCENILNDFIKNSE